MVARQPLVSNLAAGRKAGCPEASPSSNGPSPRPNAVLTPMPVMTI
jgi:hypothetical protein